MSGGSSGGSSPALVAVAVAGLLVAWGIYARRRDLLGIREGFELAGADDARITGFDEVTGTLQGQVIRYVIEMRNKNGVSRTRVIASTPPGAAALEMHLRPQTADDVALTRRGMEIDVVLGSPVFDDAFLVEAAPADAVRGLLDERTRGMIHMQRPCELEIVDGAVTFLRRELVAAPVEAAEMVRLVAEVATRLVSVGQEQEAQRLHALRDDAGAYRGLSATEAASALRHDPASAEIARLHEVRARRWSQRVVLVVVAAAILGLGLVLAVLASR